MNDYLKRKIQFKLVDFMGQINKDRLHKMQKSIIVVTKDRLTEKEFEEFIREIEGSLKKGYDLKRIPQKITKNHHLLLVSNKNKVLNRLPNNV